MRLNNYISEAVYSYDSFEVVRQVYDNSFPYLREYMRSFRINIKTPMLYSGRSSKDIWFKRNIRTDRYPKDTPGESHNVVDEMFYDAFNVKARSNSIFCTGKSKEASNYGTIYGIFPTGNDYIIIWSPKITDFYSEIIDSGDFGFIGWDLPDIVYNIQEYDSDLEDQAIDDLKERFESENDYEDYEDEFAWEDAMDEYVDDNISSYLEEIATEKAETLLNNQTYELRGVIRDSYKKGGLKNAIYSNNEIMLSGKSYIAVRYDFLPFILRYMEVHGPKKPTINLFREAMEGADFKNYPKAYHMPTPRINKEFQSILDISDLKKK